MPSPLNSSNIIAQFAQFGTIMPGTMEAQRWQYYDYVRLPTAGTNLLTFFSNPLGSVDPVSVLPKTIEETNLRRAGQFDYLFAIRTIRTHISVLPAVRQPAGAAAVTDLELQSLTPVYQVLRGLFQQGVLQISFGQKNFIQIEQPFQKCPPGFGAVVSQIGAHAATGTFQPLSAYATQSIDPRDLYVVDPLVAVEQAQTLQAAINFYLANSPAIPLVGGASIAVNIGLILDGYVIRPVQ